MEKIKYLVSGDCTVCVEFGNEISPEINRRIRAFKIALEKERHPDGVVETIPTYRPLSVVHYRPEVIRFGEAVTKKFDAVRWETHGQYPDPAVRRSSRSLCSTAGRWGPTSGICGGP